MRNLVMLPVKQQKKAILEQVQIGLFNRKPKTSIEDFCRQFYDSQVFCIKAGDEGRASTLWQNALNSIAEADPSLVKVDRDLLRREMTALHIELFGLAWTHYLWSDLSMGEWTDSRNWHSDYQLKRLIKEIVFTKRYLKQNEHFDIWNSMLAYNEAIAGFHSKSYGDAERAITDESFEYFIKAGADADCAGRLRNRMYEFHFSDNVLDHLIDTFVKRLGWDIKPDSEIFLRLQAVLFHLYTYIGAYIDCVVIDIKGTVKSKFYDSAKSVGFGVGWVLVVCWLGYSGEENPLLKLALIVVFGSPGIYFMSKGVRNLRHLLRIRKALALKR